RRRHTRCLSDWSSDVCSSDLLARAQPNAEVRDEAVEQYARSAAPESALVLLVDRLANDSSSDVQVEAVERLADLPDGLGIPALREAARSHPSRHVRAEARRRLEDYRYGVTAAIPASAASVRSA